MSARAASFWLAARPRTLPASASPVVLGTALAAAEGRARPGLAAAALVTAMALQVAANFANDVADFERGADGSDRTGPARAVATGLVTSRAMWRATAVALAVAATAGSLLVWAGGWPFALLGALSLGAAVAYTSGPYPLAYHGLGEITVFVFFGLVAVVGTAALQTGSVSVRAVVAAFPSACLATAILVVNNARDVETDARVGKRTLAVLLGPRVARSLYAGLVAAAFAGLVGLVAARALPATALVALLLLPLAFRISCTVLAPRDAAAQNAALVRTAGLHAAFTLLVAAGLLA